MNDLEKQAALFNALGDLTRLKLLKTLSNQQNPDALCVNALTYTLEISQPAVSQHLKVLKSVGLVRSQKRGNHIHYSVDAEAFKNCQELMATLLGPLEKSEEDHCRDCHNGSKRTLSAEDRIAEPGKEA